MCIASQDGCLSRGITRDDKGGEKVVGRGVMITGGVLMLPSMPKGEIVDQWLSLMSTQAALEATPILQGHFDLTT